MLDLTETKELLNEFSGSEVKKTIIYNGVKYMVKFPDPVRMKDAEISYINNVYSEDIGCKIFKIFGIPTQDTFLATYMVKNKCKVVVACRDFRPARSRLVEASTVVLSNMSQDRKLQASVEDVNLFIDNLNTSEKQKQKFKAKFWDMFVVDTLIGNVDRHMGNWGFLVDAEGDYEFAPIYDCGSALSPLKSDDEMVRILHNAVDFKNEEYNLQSVYKYKNRRLAYHEFYRELPDGLMAAVQRMVPKIDMGKIEDILTSTETLTSVRKEYLLAGIKLRNDLILQPALRNTYQYFDKKVLSKC